MHVETWAIDRVIRYEKNPRHNDAAVAKVAASLKEFGWRQPVVVDAKGVIIVGDTRYLAARSLGMTEVPVHPALELTAEQARAYRIADNRVAQESEWDDEKLIEELLSLKLSDYDLAQTGFDDDELEKILAGHLEEEPEEPPAAQKFRVMVECQDEREQETVFLELRDQGYTVAKTA